MSPPPFERPLGHRRSRSRPDASASRPTYRSIFSGRPKRWPRIWMSSPDATSALMCRLNDARSSRGILSSWSSSRDAGGMVHPLAHQRENLVARKHVVEYYALRREAISGGRRRWCRSGRCWIRSPSAREKRVGVVVVEKRRGGDRPAAPRARRASSNRRWRRRRRSGRRCRRCRRWPAPSAPPTPASASARRERELLIAAASSRRP